MIAILKTKMSNILEASIKKRLDRIENCNHYLSMDIGSMRAEYIRIELELEGFITRCLLKILFFINGENIEDKLKEM